MIVRTFYERRFDGVDLYRTHSDGGYFILQNETGVKYGEAIDVEGAPYTYSETDELIPIDESQEEKLKAEQDGTDIQ